MGRNEEAREALTRSLAKRPGFAPAHHLAGLLSADGERHAEAIESFDRAIALRPRFDAAFHSRGVAQAATGDQKSAMESFRAALSINPRRFDSAYALAGSLQSVGDHDAALKAYADAVALNPQSADVHHDMNELAWSSGRHDQLYRSYAIARRAAPGSAEVLRLEGEALLHAQRPQEAGELFARAAKMEPRRADIADARARAALAAGEMDSALSFHRAAMELAPDSVDFRKHRAITHLKGGQSAQALKVLEAAREQAPLDQEILGCFILALRQSGDERYAHFADPDRFVRVMELRAPKGFSSAADFNHELAAALTRLHDRKYHPMHQTLRGGTQTLGNLFDSSEPVVVEARHAIEEALRRYIGEFGADADHPFLGRLTERIRFQGSWSCLLQTGGYHTNHVHKEGWISSAYYVELPEVAPGEPERAGWLNFSRSCLELGEGDRVERSIEPQSGFLALFPSYLWHGTQPFSGGGRRMTIAFDVVPQ